MTASSLDRDRMTASSLDTDWNCARTSLHASLMFPACLYEPTIVRLKCLNDAPKANCHSLGGPPVLALRVSSCG